MFLFSSLRDNGYNSIIWSNPKIPAAVWYPGNLAARSHPDLMVASYVTVVAAGRMPAETTESLPEELAFVVTASELAEKVIAEEAEVVVAGQEQQVGVVS